MPTLRAALSLGWWRLRAHHRARMRHWWKKQLQRHITLIFTSPADHQVFLLSSLHLHSLVPSSESVHGKSINRVIRHQKGVLPLSLALHAVMVRHHPTRQCAWRSLFTTSRWLCNHYRWTKMRTRIWTMPQSRRLLQILLAAHLVLTFWPLMKRDRRKR